MRLVIAVIAALLSGAVLPGVAAAASYRLDPDHTFPSLEFSHMGISVWRGKFNRTTGSATLDLAARTGTVQVRVETDSIDFGLDSMHEYAVRPDWLDVAKFPVMTYTGSLVFEGDKPVAVDGQLTLRGVTRPLKAQHQQLHVHRAPFLQEGSLRRRRGRTAEPCRLRHDPVRGG